VISRNQMRENTRELVLRKTMRALFKAKVVGLIAGLVLTATSAGAQECSELQALIAMKDLRALASSDWHENSAMRVVCVGGGDCPKKSLSPALRREGALARSGISGFAGCELLVLSWAGEPKTTLMYSCQKPLEPINAPAEIAATALILRTCLAGWGGPHDSGATEKYEFVALARDGMSVHLNRYGNAIALSIVRTSENN
jgi:hypothetical protein